MIKTFKTFETFEQNDYTRFFMCSMCVEVPSNGKYNFTIGKIYSIYPGSKLKDDNGYMVSVIGWEISFLDNELIMSGSDGYVFSKFETLEEYQLASNSNKYNL